MNLTRIKTGETVHLEDGFLWSDEFDWQPIKQQLDYAVDGTPIVQEGKKKGGRPITLLSKDASQGWIQRKYLNQLHDWSIAQAEQFTLQFTYPHDTRSFKVIFNHENTAFEATPVKEFPTVSEDDYYNVTLRLLEFTRDAN
ncbi:hypothetical protein [Acinetobacter sp. MD2(2019)]|uniref:hypothetical protein n=1 Tax=Acinetobacter sp. MD2(2019) TaxID=2605273 RepID=UPI002D1E722D|nr:hypothetical protein [Acinetobacter sp. MD2(2019)]MEB3753823.1 hypothetical protein [Acinetobacter sp. MD2(2019)]